MSPSIARRRAAGVRSLFPLIAEAPVSGLSGTAATISGTINPNGSLVTTYQVEYGATTAYGSTVTLAPAPGSGTSAVAVSASLSGLTASTNYHARITAINTTGTSHGQDILFQTITDPSAIANLSAWFKADALALSDGTAVSSWADSSGNAQTATQATGSKQPIYHTAQVNGLPAVQFTASSLQVLNSAQDMEFLAGPGFTVFTVVKPTSIAAATIIGPSVSDGLSFDMNSSGTPRLNKANTGIIGSGSTAFVNTTWVRRSADFANTSGGAWHHFCNGTADGSGTSATVLSAPSTLHIGSQTTSAFWDGFIAEVLIFERVLNSTERGEMDLYLANKYGF